jgi:hypothetical protein
MNKTKNDVLSAFYCLKTLRCRKIIFNWLGEKGVTKDSYQTGQEQNSQIEIALYFSKIFLYWFETVRLSF